MNVTRELIDLAERLADNAHQIWAKQKMEDLELIGQFTYLIKRVIKQMLVYFALATTHENGLRKI